MNKLQQELAELYFSSNTVKFGAFKLSIHEKDPTLPLSPIYLHYPKDNEEGSEQLPRIYDLIGEIFADMVKSTNISFDRIVGIPNGARPLADNLAKRLPNYPANLVEFEKKVDEEGKRSFSGPSKGEHKPGENLLLVEDHTSGGYNKSLFIAAADDAGLKVTDILTVVDRQQGAPAYLSSIGVELHSIYKVEELVNFYVEKGLVTAEKAAEVHTYLENNQIIVGS